MQKLPSFLQPYFPSYNLEELDIEKYKTIIITAILNKGDYQALQWLTSVYTKKEIQEIVGHPKRGMWYAWILEYWVKILGITLPKEQFNKAIISL